MPDFALSSLIALAVVLITAHAAETILGFGATIIALALGAQFLPVERLLPVLILLGIVQSVWNVARGFKKIDVRRLAGLILPAAGAGLVIGIFTRDAVEPVLLRKLLGAFVVGISVFELVLLARGGGKKTPMATAKAIPLLTAGGIVHGMFATGGPLIVYYASRAIFDQAVFRATLSTLWLVLNMVLVGQLVFAGELSSDTLSLAGIALPAALAGIALGERIRVNARTFQALTYGLLLLAGAMLLIRS